MRPSDNLPASESDKTETPSRPWLSYYDPEVSPHLSYPRVPLHYLLDETAKKYPHRPCANFYGRRFTYRQMKDLSDRVADGALRSEIRKGDRVILLLPNSPQFIIAYFGLLKAGAVVVPVNPLSTEQELSFFANDSCAGTIITLPLFLKKAVSLRGKTPLTQFLYSRISDFLPFPLNLPQGWQEWKLVREAAGAGVADLKQWLQQEPTREFVAASPSPDEMAILIYSGGTTGVAKGIMLSHFSCVANAHQIVAWGNLNEQMRILAVLPLFHGMGMSTTMNAPVLQGSEIVLLPRFNAKATLRALSKYKPTFFIGVPTMFVAFSNVPGIRRYDLSSLKGILVGGAPLTRAIKDDFEAKTGGRMIEGYGLTEAVTATMANPFRGQHKIGSIGIPFPDVDAKIVSLENGRDLAPGELGEIVLRGPTVMLGYYHDVEETNKTLLDGWLHTGDIGYMDKDGYFYITDRKKELIIVGGFNVFPREIDELIYRHPKVREGITVGLPDPYKGERIKVYLVLKDGQTATPEEFVAYFRERLTAYKVPSDVEFRTELPKSMIGKILRRALREEETGKMKAGSPHEERLQKDD